MSTQYLNKMDNMLRLINKRLDTAKKSLGMGSQLYSELESIVKASLPNNKFVKTGKDTSISISRSKEAKNTLNPNTITHIYNKFLNMTVKEAKQKIVDEIKKRREKPTAEKIREEAANQHDLSQNYGEDIEYLYNYEGYEDVAMILNNTVRQKDKRTYDELREVRKKADEYRSNEKQPKPKPPTNTAETGD